MKLISKEKAIEKGLPRYFTGIPCKKNHIAEIKVCDNKCFECAKLYDREYTPIGKVIYGLEALKKIKSASKSEYVLRPDFINYFNLLD